MEKNCETCALHIYVLLNNLSLSELADLEEVDQSFEKSNCGSFKIFDFCLCLSLKVLRKS